MHVFDRLAQHPSYRGDPARLRRLRKRHELVIRPYAHEIAGARVLDLGAHDGRWGYAFAAAGAASVLGIEARPEMIAEFRDFPDDDYRARVDIVEGDVFAGLQTLADDEMTFDVVAVLGLFYHVMDHLMMLQLIRTLQPKLVIVDGAFSVARGAVIELVREKAGNPLNGMARRPGHETVLAGRPSRAGMEALAEAAGFALTWGDASVLAKDTKGVGDYFRDAGYRRAVCALRPV